MVLAERPVGLTGVNLLGVLGVGGADGQRLAALAALDKPGKQAGFPVLSGARWRDFSLYCTMAKLLLSMKTAVAGLAPATAAFIIKYSVYYSVTAFTHGFV